MDDWRGWIRYFQYENIQNRKDLTFLQAGSLDTSEILNPEFGVWETGPTLPIDSKAGCAVTLNDEETKHLLVPGETANGQTWTYDWLGSRTWEDAGTLSVAGNFNFKCTRVLVENGARDLVVVAGGRFTDVALATIDIYNIASGTW